MWQRGCGYVKGVSSKHVYIDGSSLNVQVWLVGHYLATGLASSLVTMSENKLYSKYINYRT